MVGEPGGKLIACFAGTKRQRAGHLSMPSPVVNVTVNLCACQAAFSRRRRIIRQPPKANPATAMAYADGSGTTTRSPVVVEKTSR